MNSRSLKKPKQFQDLWGSFTQEWTQSSLLVGRSTFDNIVAVKKIVHSLEYDIQVPNGMLINIIIKKAYDVLEWNFVLATLKLINFPDI